MTEIEQKKAKKREYDKLYYQENRAKKLVQMQEWAETHREHSRAIKKKYSDANRLRWRSYCHSRRQKIREFIDFTKIRNWDSRVCGICSNLIDGEFHIDHRIPLSRGGEHSLENLQLAHPFCNMSKNNKLPKELEATV